MASSKIKTAGFWALIILTALAFLGAGGAKLAGVEMVHQSFNNMGLPAFSGYVVGLLEVVAALALLLGAFRFHGALLLAVTMVGAALYHLAYDPISAVVPALVLLLMTLAIAWQAKPVRTSV